MLILAEMGYTKKYNTQTIRMAVSLLWVLGEEDTCCNGINPSVTR